MFVNTKIVNALLRLRCIPRAQLCAVTGISVEALCAWLDGSAEDSDDRLPFERQLEVLKVLGVVGDNPRKDVVHNWTIHESAFRSNEEAYEPLATVLSCFGRAEVVHLAPEKDPVFSFSARTFFGLTFSKFRAVLEIVSPAFKALAFNPDSLPNLSWAATGAALVMPIEKFRQLTSLGEATPALFDQERVLALEHYQWQKLIALTHDHGVGAGDVVKLVMQTLPETPALTGPKPKRTRRKTSSARKSSSSASQEGPKEEAAVSSIERTVPLAAASLQPTAHTEHGSAPTAQ